jgi:hypothetical protein
VIQDRDKLVRLKEECVNSALERIKKRPNYDPDRLEALRSQHEKRYGDFLSAPVYVVVLVDKQSKYPSYNRYDGAVAAGYLMIAARALGYGTVFSQDTIPYPLIKKVLGIPDNFERICFTPIGIPEGWPPSPPKKPLHEFAVFERLINGVNYTVKVTRKAMELPAALLDSYVSRYEFEGGAVIAVTREGARLYIQADGQEKIEAFAEGKDRLFLKVADVQLEFLRDDQGQITGMTLIQDGRELPGKKTK